MAVRSANASGVLLTSAGMMFVIAAAWTHVDSLGVIGLLLWVPGIILYARWVCALRRLNRADPRLNPQAARSAASRDLG